MSKRCWGRVVAVCLAGLALVSSPVFAAGGNGGGGGGGGGGSSGGDPELPGEILLKLRSTQALQPVLAKHALSLVGRFGARPIYRTKVSGSARTKDVIAALAADPDVMIAEPNPTQRSPEARKNVAWVIGTESAWAAQWAPQALQLAQAQSMSRGAGVRVAVLDTGVDARHPALAGRLLAGRDFVDDDLDAGEGGSAGRSGFGHGTHVAGLVALAAPEAQIVPVRVLDADGVGNAWVLAEALLWAIDPDGDPNTPDGAQVVNISLGSLARTRIMDTIALIASCGPVVPDDAIADRSDPGYSDDAVRCAAGSGAVIVAAAGNDSSGSLKEYPAAEGAYGLLSVGATTASGRVAGFSNYGPWVDLAAPGEGITSAVPGGWATWSGTSMAAPLVAGTAALVRAAVPSLPAKDVVQRLKRAATETCDRKLPALDAAAAVAGSRNPQPLACR